MSNESDARILIVDDDVSFVAAAAEIATLAGVYADTAGSLAAARAKLRTDSFDLMLLDLELPDGSGLVLLDELDPTNHVPVAIITGTPSVDSAVRAARLPVVDYLVKPLDHGALRALFSKAINAMRQQPAQILFRVGMTLEEVECQMLFKTLAYFNNHKPKAAQTLGISLKTVYNRLARFGHAHEQSHSVALG